MGETIREIIGDCQDAIFWVIPRVRSRTMSALRACSLGRFDLVQEPNPVLGQTVRPRSLAHQCEVAQ